MAGCGYCLDCALYKYHLPPPPTMYTSTLRICHVVSVGFHMFPIDGDFNCTLEDILIFFTGAERVPVLGFELVPKLSFLESSPLRLLPTASTCSLELRLPTYHHNYITFKEYMSVGLKGCEGFGGV